MQVAILGAGGFARELRWAIDTGTTVEGKALSVVAFVDVAAHDEPLKGLPVVALDQLTRDVLLVCGIGGMTQTKLRVVTDALAHGFRFAPAVVAASAVIGPDVSIGDGSVVCAGAVVTADVTIGEHVAVHVGCLIGHDASIGDFATLSPGSRISGGVDVGRGAFLGTGAAVIEQLHIGADSVVGAGAVVISNVPAGSLAVGVPARVRKTDRRA